MRSPRVAVLLLAGVLLSSCVTSPPSRETPFQRELSSAIERMLKAQAARRQKRPASAEARRSVPARPAIESTEIFFDPEPRPVRREEPWRRPRSSPESGRGDSLMMPVDAAVKLTDNFGAPRSGGRRHKGLDLLAPRGTRVVAAAGGIVSKVSNHPRGGNCAWVISPGGLAYYYAHLDRFAADLEPGQEIRGGELIGYVGTTGNAAGGPPHLHFEVHRYGEATNPYPLLLRARPTGYARAAASSAAR